MRFFNTAGPVRSEIHYCLPPLDKLPVDIQSFEVIRENNYLYIDNYRRS